MQASEHATPPNTPITIPTISPVDSPDDSVGEYSPPVAFVVPEVSESVTK